jgi:hypothetical protein
MAQERYMALNGKYLQDAERLLEEGDWTQASEKFWGAVAEVVKVVAAGRGWRHFSHRELREAVERLFRETGDGDFVRLFAEAESLHANFYENWMAGDTVKLYADDMRRLIDKLRPLA